jgi:hypothetical protein
VTVMMQLITKSGEKQTLCRMPDSPTRWYLGLNIDGANAQDGSLCRVGQMRGRHRGHGPGTPWRAAIVIMLLFAGVGAAKG